MTAREAMALLEVYRTSESRTSCDGQQHWRLVFDPDEDDQVMLEGRCDCVKVTA